MADYNETELKLRFLNSCDWERIFASPILTEQADPLSFRVETLEAQYYDTPSHQLQKGGLAFRIRREGGVWLATIKDSGGSIAGLQQRAEWSVPVSEPKADIAVFMDTPVGPRLAETVGEETLIALFRTRFDRQILELHARDGSIIELAADRGEISFGDEQLPILEIGLELKSGHVGVLLQLGADLAKEFPLLPEWRSKYFRGLQLAGLVDGDEAAPPASLSFEDTEVTGTVLARILISCIQQILVAQERFLQWPEDPETLHQFRIHLRRTRSLLSFSKPRIPQETYIQFQKILKHWGGVLAPLREIDAVLETWYEVKESGWVHFTAKPVLGDILRKKRGDLAIQIYNKLKEGQAIPELLEIWAWLLNNELLLQAAGDEEPEIAVQPQIVDFARARLGKWVNNMIKAGNNIETQQDEMLHKLRIRGKRLRYALGALGLRWPKKSKKTVVCLKELQESIGYLHDTLVNHRLLQKLLQSQSSRLMYRDTGILTGWQAHKAVLVHQKIKKQWKRFLRDATTWSKKV